MPEKKIGKVTHYFSNIGVVIIKFTGELRLGETIHIKGATTDFEQTVESMQVEHKPVSEAKAGDETGIKISGKVREGDVVYKVVPE
jgi:translation elongation factor EF-1alpha